MLKTIAIATAVLVPCTVAFAQGKEAEGRHQDGWRLGLICPTAVKKGGTCKMQARLSFVPTGKGTNKVATGKQATVESTIADRDTLSRDDVVLTRSYRFGEGEKIKFLELGLCGNLKKDIRSKSEIYAKVRIRISYKGVGKLPIIDYKATVKTPTIKVKTVK